MRRWQSPCLVFHMVPNNTMRDLVQGIPTRELVDGIQPARVGDEEVLVVKRGTEVFAIGAHCTITFTAAYGSGEAKRDFVRPVRIAASLETAPA